jgi:methylmalonyl-CoA mutase
VAQTAKWRADQLGKRRAVLIGTNMYPNPGEQPLEPREPSWSAVCESRSATVTAAREGADGSARDAALGRLGEARGSQLVEAAVDAAAAGATLGEIHGARAGVRIEPVTVTPLAIHRAGDMYERLRELADEFAERRGRRPQVFLANLGPIKQHKARADFSAGFFEVGFFEMLGNDGFGSPEDAARAAGESGAEVAVICSTDDTYPELVPRFMKGFKTGAPRPIVILAGYPKDQIDAHREVGVDDFIHLKADNYSLLGELLERIGAGS